MAKVAGTPTADIVSKAASVGGLFHFSCQRSSAAGDPAANSPPGTDSTNGCASDDQVSARKRLAALLVHLVVDRLRDLGQPAAIGGAADDIADAAIGPEQRAVFAVGRIPHLRRLG